MADLRRNSRTRLTLDKLEYNVPLKEEDFTEATQIFECQIHSARTVYNTLTGIAPQNRASAMTSESMVCRYSEEFLNAGRKHYGLSDRDLTFFSVHMVADQEHTAAHGKGD
jgi:pyrroloquinoline quinone (PQQ) biosynthesis protein C